MASPRDREERHKEKKEKKHSKRENGGSSTQLLVPGSGATSPVTSGSAIAAGLSQPSSARGHGPYIMIKCYAGEHIKMFETKQSTMTLATLLQDCIDKSFKDQNSTEKLKSDAWRLQYADPDGDLISLSTQSDLELALVRFQREKWTSIKLHLLPQTQTVTTPSSALEARPKKMIRMKCQYKDDIKLTETSRVENLQDLHAFVEKLFNLKELSSTKYKDENGDLVAIKTQEDLEFALFTYFSLKLPKLHIVVK